MIIKEIEGNLFTAPADYTLAHCISADCAMGMGIALQFRNRGVRDMLLGAAENGRLRWDGEGYCLTAYTDDGRRVFNLVTKEKFFMKPTYNTLRQSLMAMRRRLRGETNPKIAMPRIGCGLDKLDWEQVYQIITDVFKPTNAEILVYHLKGE